MHLFPVRPPVHRFTKKAAAAIAGMALLPALNACGGSTTPSDPAALLRTAKQTLDATSGVHFTLQSRDVTGDGTAIRGGSGDMVRPDGLQGSLDVVVKGLQATVKVVAVGNKVEAQLPFASTYSVINPSAFGLGNPSQLLDPQHGLSSLLTAGTNSKLTGTERIGGELLDEVTTSVPGQAVPLLPNQNPSQPVVLVASIDPSNHQLRQVTLIGPFTSASTNATFTVTLTNYGEHILITLPPAS